MIIYKYLYVKEHPNINLKNIFSLRTIEDGIKIKQKMLTSKNAVLLGGGYISIEVMEALVHNKLNVTLIEKNNQILKMFDEDFSQMITDYIIGHNIGKVNIFTNEEVIEFVGNENNEVTKNSLYKSNSGIIFRDNASFISTLHQYDLPEIEDIYDFFFFVNSNVSYLGLHDGSSANPALNPYIITKDYANDSQMLSFVEKKIRQFDTGIEKIVIKSHKDEQNNDIFFPVFLHTVEANKKEPLLYEKESSGTKALYNKLKFYYLTLKTGGVLILDEFDINLHTDILPHLLDLFINKENNPQNAQIIFTTHSNEIMDILGRYRTYLVQKENGESFCYRLDELPPEHLRNDRPISVPYRKHLIGGYPKIGAEEN